MRIEDIDKEVLELVKKASKKLCKSSRSNKDLGASNRASCKSKGFRRR